MKRFMQLPKFIIVQILLALVVGCTLTGPAPSPTIGVQTQTVIVPGIETASSTPTQTPTATLAVNNTAIPTFTPSPTATVCATPSKGITYIVQQGDTLNQIALRYNMSAEELQQANCLPSADTIFAGQTIYVPFYLPPVLIQPTAVPPVAVPPQPTQHKIPEGLKEEIGYHPGGANDSPTCIPPTPGVILQITLSPRVRDTYEMCVYGFPLNQQITIKMMAPDGHLVASKGFQVMERVGDTTIVRIPLWMPVGVPIGSWTVTAQAVINETTISVTRSINIERSTQPAINTLPEGEINPLESYKCGHYQPGSRMVIRGANYMPNAQLPLAFYLFPPPPATDNLRFTSAEFVETDGEGDFSTVITIGGTDTGDHLVVLVVNPSLGDYFRINGDNDCYTVP